MGKEVLIRIIVIIIVMVIFTVVVIFGKLEISGG
tara:strand:- start:53 stop:154 length:102 start_codon:yes stop_codon:yes gene_type:complete